MAASLPSSGAPTAAPAIEPESGISVDLGRPGGDSGGEAAQFVGGDGRSPASAERNPQEPELELDPLEREGEGNEGADDRDRGKEQ